MQLPTNLNHTKQNLMTLLQLYSSTNLVITKLTVVYF
jgi:hypothetical protein